MIDVTIIQSITVTESMDARLASPKPAPALDHLKLEQTYHEAMTAMRQQNNAAFSSEKKMPFALKQRHIERPLLTYSVEKALSQSDWRRVIVQSLIENVENGPGHLSVHRAKDALKKIASSIGMAKLTTLLNSMDATDAVHAAHLLGWLKNPRAAIPLLAACERRHPQAKQILSVLTTHYTDYSHSIVAGGFDVMS